MIVIWSFGCLYQKPALFLCFVKMSYLLQHIPNNHIASIKKIMITDSSRFSDIERLCTITVNLWNEIISSKWNRKAHWSVISSFRPHLIMKINKKLSFFHLAAICEWGLTHAVSGTETEAPSPPIPISHSIISCCPTFSVNFLKLQKHVCSIRIRFNIEVATSLSFFSINYYTELYSLYL